MNIDDHHDLEAVAADVRDAEVAYGAVLIGETLTHIECVDVDAIEAAGDDPDVRLLSILGQTREELGQFIDESERSLEEVDLGRAAAPHVNSEREPSRTAEFSEAAALVEESWATYLVINEGEEWRSVRDCYPDKFEANDPLAGILVIAFSLVDEARERIREQPQSVQEAVNDTWDGAFEDDF
jgi:hypothetical protein